MYRIIFSDWNMKHCPGWIGKTISRPHPFIDTIRIK